MTRVPPPLAGVSLPLPASSHSARGCSDEDSGACGMAAGEGGAESLPPPSPAPHGPLPGPERALEEAAASGSLSLAGRRLRHFPGGAARRWDLSDTTQADLSRNRFAEVPEDACQLVSLEGLSLYHNCLRSIPPAIANLQALTYLNVSRNQLASLPPCLCRLPLKVLIASNNKLAFLPEDLGALSHLRQLDVSSNELQALPASVAGLESLRDLNVRRNQLSRLPEELADLPLVRLDISCNRVARIPVCYRHLRHLQSILLENNPLQFPPAQVCLKGKIHIFKYLNIEACSRARSDLAEFTRGNRPTGFGTCLPDDFYPLRQYGGLDSGFNSVDSGSKRWSGNESTDEFSDLSFRIAELARDPKQLKERCNGAVDAGELEQIDYIDSSLNGEEEEAEVATGRPEGGSRGVASVEEQPRAGKSPLPKAGAAEHGLAAGRASSGAGLSGEERPRRPPEVFQLWQERERQQQQQQQQQQRPLWSQAAAERRDSGLAESSSGSGSSFSQLKYRSQGSEPLAGSPRQAARHTDPAQLQSSLAASPSPREPSSAQKPSSFLFRSSSSSSRSSIQRSANPSSAELSSPWRLPTGWHALEERELSVQLRKAIELQLNITLAEDLAEALANGVVLCQLVNHLRPRSVPFIHVPSPAVPKLNAMKSRKNVESFLTACRQLGVPEELLCSPSHVLEEEGLPHVAATVHALLGTDVASTPRPWKTGVA
ncbi:leucine-rich repeat and calponin homology domain-containing protein 4 isoform X2 [Hemicordylus capensis]|uniref:leucine-rich repeat and calponin homology domain-containing protein 4 isoform X2 n=1 Tax=Hemicordylus capensis TaxID=884348 RepID=UPI0023039C3B|nr:leucine-rich repeat and calponin homology domain-containing protein 4 isoform X2 [Hemicordylus capensis]